MSGRRELFIVALGGIALSTVKNAAAETPVTIALLHLAPRPGDVGHNKRRVENAIGRLPAMGVKLIVTPELAVSGYGFRDASSFLLLGTPEAADGALFNRVILFAPDGSRVGHHRKINVLRTGSESWSSPGDQATVLAIDGIGRVGLAICADMYSERLVNETASRGPDLLASSAAWARAYGVGFRNLTIEGIVQPVAWSRGA